MSIIEDVLWFACVWVAWRLLWWMVYGDGPVGEVVDAGQTASVPVIYDPRHYATDAFAKQLVVNWRDARTQRARDIAEGALEALGLWMFRYLPGQDRDEKIAQLGDPTFGSIVDEFEYVALDDDLMDQPLEWRRCVAVIHTTREV